MFASRVLFVDDYEDALTMWAIYLEARGYDVTIARDGGAAVTLATEMRPDVIIMDLVLPGIDGCEAARRMRAMPALADVPIIATTGNTDPRVLQEAYDSGFDAMMIKPCDPPALVDEIERQIGARHARASAPA